VVVVVAFGIKVALIQSLAAVVVAAAAQIKTAIDLEYGAATELLDRVFRVALVCDTIEKAIMLMHQVAVAVQADQAFTAWIPIMMALQRTVVRVLPVTL
jgi:hypothetical protein